MAISRINSRMVGDGSVDNTEHGYLDGATSNVQTQLSGAGYDDASIRADILKLALHQAVDGNRVAYNLENSFIDGFEDDTGITTQTNVERVTSGEYFASMTQSVGAFASDSNTVVLLHMDDAACTDSSSNSHTTTLTGNATRSSTQSKFGSYSLYMTAGNLKLPVHADFGFGTGDYTIEGWVYDTTSQNNNPFYDNGTWGTNNYDLVVRANTNNWQIGIYNGSSDRYLTDSTTLALNTWHHIAVTRSSGTTFLHRNGTYVGGTAQSGWVGNENLAAPSSQPRIGSNTWASLNGYIDEFRISDVARYSASTNFTPNQTGTSSATGTLISDPQTASSSRTSVSGVIIYEDSVGTATLGTDFKIYFTANNGSNWTEASSYGTATTYSGTKKLVTLGSTTVTAGTQVAIKAEWANQAASVGTAKAVEAVNQTKHSTTQSKVPSSSSSIYFDGTGDELRATNSSSDFAFGTGDFTVAAWIRWDAQASNNPLIGNRQGAVNDAWMFYISTSNNLAFSSGTAILLSSSSTIAATTWTHCAVVRDSGTLRIYKDGTQVGTASNSNNFSSTNRIFCGAGDTQGNSDFAGYMDEIRISNNCRYPSGTSFTPSTTAFSGDSNTKLLIQSNTTNNSTTFTDTSPIFGKETHLNGWAVNY